MKGGKHEMKKKHLLMLVVLLFSFITETLPSLVTAHAETTKTELIDEKFLNVSYDYESLEDTNRWQITFSRQSEESDKEHRLKLKVTDEKGKVITYPTIKNMDEKDDWLIEKNFSASMEGQLVFELPKTTKKLNLDVQMDEQTLSNGKDAKVQENILDIKDSFVLKVKDTKEESKKSNELESKDKPAGADIIKTVADDSDKFVASKKGDPVVSEVESKVGLLRMDPAKYTNKEPVYTTNNGKYPTCYWTPTGQSNVRNHQGGYERESGWDGNTGWNISPDNYTNSYIHYGVEKTKPNISLRKYASETSDDNEFNIRLNVRGSTIAKPGVDVCFVLDNSASMKDTKGNIGSMKRKDLSVKSLQNLINKFKAAGPETDSLRIGGIVYSSSEQSGYPNATVPLSSSETNWQNLVNTYQRLTPDGNTYTQKALRNAQTMLNNASGTNRRKVIFLLTDGAPNFSLEPAGGERDSNIYYDGVRITSYFSNTIEQGKALQDPLQDPWTGTNYFTTKIPKGYYLPNSGQCIYSHLTPLNSTAHYIKNQGMEINTIAINVKKTLNMEGHTTDELVRGLYKAASKKANATGDQQKDYQFYNASTTGEFDISFDDWFTSVIQTVDKGEIDDPIGEMFDLVGTPTVKEIKKSGVPAIESGKMAKIDNSDSRKVKVNNINLYGNQEIQVDYKVRLKTDHKDYEGDTWYQTNGRTTLTPTPERTTDKLDFGVPSVKGKANKFEIPVEKKWSDSFKNTDDYWGLRANSVKVVLQRKSGNSWVDVETKTLNAANNWKASFSAEGGSNIYRVVEPSRTTGYAKPDSNVDEFTAKTLPSKGVQITNKLLKGATVFCKYKEDGKTPFTSDLPRFTVRRKSDGKVLVSDLEPNTRGQVVITDIPLGDFVVEETYVPQGYDKMDDIDVKAVENSAGTDLNITVNGKTSLHEVTNKLTKDLEIPVEKLWSDSYRGTENYWGLRTNYVRVTLQKRTGSTWEDVESLTLTPIDSWKGVFQNVEGGNTVYRVVEETRTTGYAKPTYNYGTSFTAATKPKDGIKLTNKLLTGKAVLCKYMDDGKTPFSKDKPKFTITRRSDGRVLATDIEPDANGQVTIENIPMGDFIIEESYVPAGYEKMANIDLKAVENAAGTALTITLNGKSSPYKVTNKLADFKLKIKKVDEDGNELRGASFRLIGTNYDRTETGGPYFEFSGLRPGEYSLSETVVPNGYQGMSGTVRISISQEGVVSIQPNSNVSGSGGVGNPNLIQLTVTNRKRGAGPLPSTGGSGTAMFFKVALGVISTAGGLLGSLYWLHTKRRGS